MVVPGTRDLLTGLLKLRAGRADPKNMFVSHRFALTALAAVAVLAGGCGGGAGAGSPATQPAPKLSATEVAQDQALKMVLSDGDLPGYSLNSTGAETLKDQLPPKRTPGYAGIVRAVKASWLASEHSVVVSADGHVQLFSDANLFRSEAAMRRMWKLDRTPIPGVHVKYYRPPAGSPAGARLLYSNDGTRAGFELAWPQGRVIGLTLLFAHPTDKFTSLGIRRISSLLSAAAKAQARRIGSVEAGGSDFAT